MIINNFHEIIITAYFRSDSRSEVPCARIKAPSALIPDSWLKPDRVKKRENGSRS